MSNTVRTLNQLIESATETQLWLWMADVAESVVHLYEREYPDDTRPRKAIQVARRYAAGDATDDELAAASADAMIAGWAVRIVIPTSAVAWFAARSAGWAVSRPPTNVAISAANAAAYAVARANFRGALCAETVDAIRAVYSATMNRYAALLAWYLDGATGDKPSIEMGDETSDPN